MNTDSDPHASWTFFTNHGHALVCLSQDSDMRLRDMADAIGITERAVYKIITDLESGGVIQRHRDGRRNHYTINRDAALRHPLESHCTVGQLIDWILHTREAAANDPSAS